VGPNTRSGSLEKEKVLPLRRFELQTVRRAGGSFFTTELCTLQ